MNRTTITCTNNGANAPADILEKSDRFMKVVMVAMTDMPISMYKNDPNDAFYVGNAAGMEFTSTGDPIGD
ncbi:MAG: hypothetical protein V3T23_04990 [Nitrososphaerales archaeon]